jgi:hypothetical protein
LKNEGKKKAYKWLVRTHIEHHSWQYYWDKSERVQKRLEFAAKHYKDKWLEYIRDTSMPARYWENRRSGFTIGHVWLVRYLMLVGQKTLAVQLTDEMVKLFVEEVHDQPITALEWLS